MPESFPYIYWFRKGVVEIVGEFWFEFEPETPISMLSYPSPALPCICGWETSFPESYFRDPFVNDDVLYQDDGNWTTSGGSSPFYQRSKTNGVLEWRGFSNPHDQWSPHLHKDHYDPNYAINKQDIPAATNRISLTSIPKSGGRFRITAQFEVWGGRPRIYSYNLPSPPPTLPYEPVSILGSAITFLRLFDRPSF